MNPFKKIGNEMLGFLPHYRKLQWLEGATNVLITKHNILFEKICELQNESLFIKKLKEKNTELKELLKPQKYTDCFNLLNERLNIEHKHKSKRIEYQLDLQAFFEQLKKYIIKTDIVLDIGCGVKPEQFFIPKVHICIEPFKEYRDIIKPFFPNPCNYLFIKEDAIKALKIFDDNSIDTIFMLDIIEHLSKKDGITLLSEADRVARKQIIVFTPLGFYPMHFRTRGQKDAWGLNGNDVQEHMSGWLPTDFGKSWDFHICKNCTTPFFTKEKILGKKYSALVAIKTKRFVGFPIMKETPNFVKKTYSDNRNKE